jgi:phasin family protein
MAKKQASPFDFDFSKYIGTFDPSKMTEEFTKAFSSFQMPGVDMNGIVESQKKNLEALTAANKTAVSGFQAVATRQAELMKQAMEASTAAAEELLKSGTPQEAAVKQVELVKTTFEKTLADMTEIAEMLAKSTNEANAAINKRISESLEEMKKLAAAAK